MCPFELEIDFNSPKRLAKLVILWKLTKVFAVFTHLFLSFYEKNVILHPI